MTRKLNENYLWCPCCERELSPKHIMLRDRCRECGTQVVERSTNDEDDEDDDEVEAEQ